MGEFKIGSCVKVKNYGKTYPGYVDWITKNAPEFMRYFHQGFLPLNTSVGKIVAMAEHISDKVMLYLIYYEEQVYIMTADGFELYESYEVELL